MNSIIWVIAAVKIFVVCWLVYILLERRKRRRNHQQNIIIIEGGTATAYTAGGPVTQLPKDCQEFYNEQLYAPNNIMPPPNMQQQAFYSHQQPPPMVMMSPK